MLRNSKKSENRLDFRMLDEARDVACDAVPHGFRGNVCEVRNHRFVVFEVIAECLRIPADEVGRDSLDVCGSDSSHVFHRVSPIKSIPYLKIGYLSSRLQTTEWHNVYAVFSPV